MKLKKRYVLLLLSVMMLMLVLPAAVLADGNEWKGTIDSQSGSTWVVGGMAFEVSGSTRMKTEHGPLVQGACAEVKFYTNGGQKVATKIKSQEASDCGGADNHDQNDDNGLDDSPDGPNHDQNDDNGLDDSPDGPNHDQNDDNGLDDSPDGSSRNQNSRSSDLNSDGKVDILDLVMMITYFDSGEPKADLNGDGIVNIFDLIILANDYQ